MIKNDISQMELAKDAIKQSVNNMSESIKNKTNKDTSNLTAINDLLMDEDISDGYVAGDEVKSRNYEEVYQGAANDYTQLWETRIHDLSVYDIICNSDGSFLSCGDDRFVKKSSKNADPIWTYAGAQYVSSMGKQSNGNIVFAQYLNVITWITANGSLIARINFPGETNVISKVLCVDSNDCVVVGVSNNRKLLKYSADRKLIWEKEYSSDMLETIAIDSRNIIYAGDSSGQVVKVSSDGDLLDTFSVSLQALASDVDTKDNYFVADVNKNIQKYNADSKLLWKKEFIRRTAHTIKVFDDNTIYVATNRNVMQIDAEGNKVWDEELVQHRSFDMFSNGDFLLGGLHDVTKYSLRKELIAYKIIGID